MFSENIISLTCCIIIEMPALRVDKFSAGRTAMLKRTCWNSLALLLKPYLGLDLINPWSSYVIILWLYNKRLCACMADGLFGHLIITIN